MTISIRLAVAVIALAVAAPSHAEDPGGNNVRFGLGVSMNTSLIGGLFSAIGADGIPATQLYVPVQFSQSLRIEPSIGWAWTRDEQDKLSNSSYSLGLGLLYVWPVASQVQSYAGVRAALVGSVVEENASATLLATTKRENWAFAAVAGAEYVASARFTFGLEGQLEHVFVGESETRYDGPAKPPNTTTKGGSATSTQALLFARTYF